MWSLIAWFEGISWRCTLKSNLPPQHANAYKFFSPPVVYCVSAWPVATCRHTQTQTLITKLPASDPASTLLRLSLQLPLLSSAAQTWNYLAMEFSLYFLGLVFHTLKSLLSSATVTLLLRTVSNPSVQSHSPHSTTGQNNVCFFLYQQTW